MEIIAAIAGALLFFTVAVLGVLLFVYVLVEILFAILRLPYLPTEIRIRRKLRSLIGPTFQPSVTFIRADGGIAIDGQSRQVFLANRRSMKLYDVSDIQAVDADFKSDQLQLSGVVRITVRDTSFPLYQLQSILRHGRLREVVSLLAVLKEPAANGNPDGRHQYAG